MTTTLICECGYKVEGATASHASYMMRSHKQGKKHYRQLELLQNLKEEKRK